MRPLQVGVRGLGAWSADHPDWPSLAAALQGRNVRSPPSTRPSPALLPPAERRRAPDGVAVALQVAAEATTGIDRTSLASVFVSAHGDLAIVDYLCATLAEDSTALSPTRFHLSVHNAASGYWTIAAQDRAPSTAIAAGEYSVAAGLLEATAMAIGERRPVLLVAFDTRASGLLERTLRNSALFGFAMVVDPNIDAAATSLTMTVDTGTVDHSLPSALEELADSSPAARALILAGAIAAGSGRVSLPLGPDLSLTIIVA